MTTRKHASRMRNARLDVSIGWGGGVGTALVYLSSPWKGPWTRDTYPPRKDLGPEIPPPRKDMDQGHLPPGKDLRPEILTPSPVYKQTPAKTLPSRKFIGNFPENLMQTKITFP